MISILLVALVGLLFGYGLIGPIADTYSARAYWPLITFVVFVMGLALFMALVIGGWIQGSQVAPLSNLLIALAGWGMYAVAIATGTAVKVRLRTGTWSSR